MTRPPEADRTARVEQAVLTLARILSEVFTENRYILVGGEEFARHRCETLGALVSGAEAAPRPTVATDALRDVARRARDDLAALLGSYHRSVAVLQRFNDFVNESAQVLASVTRERNALRDLWPTANHLDGALCNGIHIPDDDWEREERVRVETAFHAACETLPCRRGRRAGRPPTRSPARKGA